LRNPRRAKSNTARAKTALRGNHPPKGNPGLKHTRMDAILRKFDWKYNFKLKLNSAGSYKLCICPITPSAAFPNLMRLSLDIIKNTYKAIKSGCLSIHSHSALHLMTI
jgi:hypothetical protein